MFKRITYTLAAAVAAAPLFVFAPAFAAPTPSLTTSTVTGPASGVADHINYTITITVRDGSNNPLVGEEVSLRSSRGNTVDTIVPEEVAFTDASGNAAFTVHTNTVGTAVFTGHIFDIGDIVDTHTMNFTSPVSAVNSSVVASPTSIAANGSSNIKLSVTARKSTNQPVSGRTATVTSSRGSQDTITPASATTDSSGEAIFNIHSCEPGSPALTTVVDGVTLTSPSITFTTDATPSAGSSELMQSAVSAPANNSTTVTITVNVVNSCNRAVAGVGVILSSSRGASDTISPATATTNTSGSAVFTVRSGTVGSSVYTAQAETVIITEQVTVTYTAVGAGDATPPSVGSVTPTSATVGVAQTYSASVSDNVGISECSFFADGVSQPTVVAGGFAQRTHVFATAGLHSLYVSCADAAGNIGTGPVTTITVSAVGGGGDVTAPVINNVTVTMTLSTSANVTWTTNEPATSLVEYGLTTSYGQSRSSTAFETNHALTITGLTPNTTYHLRVSSDDTSGNVGRGSDLTFTTPPAAVDGRPTPGSLIKLACPPNAGVNDPCKEVSYVGVDGARHSFPNQAVFFTWFPGGFSSVTIQTITPSVLVSFPLGRNVTHKPGVKLVKSPTNPKVYAVTKGDSSFGRLREVTTPEIGVALYGAAWARSVTDFSDVFMLNSYRIGAAITVASGYSPTLEQSQNATIDASMGL